MICGLDLSLRRTAAVAAPDQWQGNWSALQTLVVMTPPHDADDEAARVKRHVLIAKDVTQWCMTHDVSEVWIESYAYQQNNRAHTLGELGGIVRLGLLQIGCRLCIANQSSARKLLLGRIPHADRWGPKVDIKRHIQGVLEAAGAPAGWAGDERDAFVCLNFGLSSRGGFCFCQEAA